MKRCPWCGEKVLAGIDQCEHCGKAIGKKKSNSEEKPRPTNLDSWKGRSVPTWLMFLLVGLALFCIYLMFQQGCSPDKDPLPAPTTQQPVIPMTCTDYSC